MTFESGENKQQKWLWNTVL